MVENVHGRAAHCTIWNALQVVISPPSWTEPLPLRDIFGLGSPLEVDVGCGKGRFLLARAAARPEANFLGIDRQRKRIQKAERKIAAAGLTNVRLLRAEASYAIGYLLPAGSVSHFYFFFPDPWPKRRHHKRRLFTAEFVERLAAALQPGGAAHIATDHSEYFAVISGLFASNSRFTAVSPPLPAENELTEFEIAFRSAGVRIHRCSFVKAV